MSLKQFIFDFIINNFETIKNISLFLVSIVASVGFIIFYIKIYLNIKKIKWINKKIEEIQVELDKNEIDSIVDEYVISFNNKSTQQKYKRKLEQDIQRLQREKEYLLEEISIFKIFKK